MSENQPSRDWAVWTGIEVEGKYSGVPTLFLFAQPDGWFDMGWLTLRPHIYICAHWLDTQGFDIIDQALNMAVVTLEVRPDHLAHLTPRQLQECHLMLAVELLPEVKAAMKLTDTVRLTFGQFNSRSYTQPVESTPADYAADELIAYALTSGQTR